MVYVREPDPGRGAAGEGDTVGGVWIDLVLAVPRGGLPVGRAVADAFEVPLDIVATKKLGAPGNPELAIGAAAADGSVWVNQDLVSDRGIASAYVESERRTAMATARKKAERYRAGREPPTLSGNRVAILDDGVATGATLRACKEAVRNADPAGVTVAIPVGPTDTLRELADRVDRSVVVERPSHFRAVGGFYQDFGQVTDEQAMANLDRGAGQGRGRTLRSVAEIWNCILRAAERAFFNRHGGNPYYDYAEIQWTPERDPEEAL